MEQKAAPQNSEKATMTTSEKILNLLQQGEIPAKIAHTLKLNRSTICRHIKRQHSNTEKATQLKKATQVKEATTASNTTGEDNKLHNNMQHTQSRLDVLIKRVETLEIQVARIPDLEDQVQYLTNRLAFLAPTKADVSAMTAELEAQAELTSLSPIPVTAIDEEIAEDVELHRDDIFNDGPAEVDLGHCSESFNDGPVPFVENFPRPIEIKSPNRFL